MAAPEIIQKLVAKFSENREAYRSGKYNEAQLRQQFLDPFFEALGWDIYNRAGVSPEYQDVKIEDSLQIEGASKAPDYAFRIGLENIHPFGTGLRKSGNTGYYPALFCTGV